MRRQLSSVFLFSAISQAAAFGKSVLIAYYFGIGTLLDGYYLGQAIPTVLSGILVGVLQTGFLTIYAGQIARAERNAAAALLGRMLVVLAVVGVSVSIVLSAAAPWLVSLLAPQSASSVQDAAVASLRVLAFLLLLNGFVDCLSLALSAHGFFSVAALAPAANALVASAILAAFPDWGLSNLIWGTLVGLFVQLLLVATEMRRRQVHVKFDGPAQLRAVANAGVGIVPGVVFANLSVLVPPIIAARMGDGAVAAFSFAARLHGAATQILAIALSTVLLPYFAHAVGRGDHAAIALALRKGLPTVALIAVAALLWVGLAGDHFVSLVFEHGAFDLTAVRTVSMTWFWLTLGLLPAIWGVVLAKALQALRLGMTMSLISLIGLVLTAALGMVLAHFAGLTGLALAVGISSLVASIACAVVLERSLAKSQGTLRARSSRLLVKAFGAATALTVVSSWADWMLRTTSEFVHLLCNTLCIGVVTVIGLRMLMRVERADVKEGGHEHG